MNLVDSAIRAAILGALVSIPVSGGAQERPRGVHGSSRTYPIALHTLRGTDAERVQEALQRFGYYQGPVDGTLGPNTRRALVEFQKDRNLEARGVLDERTVQLLGLDPQELLESRITLEGANEADDRVPVRGEDDARDADGGSEEVMPQDADDTRPTDPPDPGPRTPAGGTDELDPSRGAEGVLPRPEWTPEERRPEGTEAAGGRRGPADPSLGLRGLPEDDVRALQQSLAGLGIYDGPVDGIAGASTYLALLRFQRENGLPATARLDPVTTARLGLDFLELQRVGGREDADAFDPADSTVPGVGVPDADQVHPHEGPGP